MNQADVSKITGTMFLDALDAAAEAGDRAAMAELSRIAFARRNLVWQAAARHADNYVVAGLQGNPELQETCRLAFVNLVPKIQAEG